MISIRLNANDHIVQKLEKKSGISKQIQIEGCAKKVVAFESYNCIN